MPNPAITDLIAQRRTNILDAEKRRIAEIEEHNTYYLTLLEAIEDMADQLSLPDPVLITDAAGVITGIQFLASLRIGLDLYEYNTLIWSAVGERPNVVASVEPLTVIERLLTYIPTKTILATGE